MIHNTAIVSKKARLGKEVDIGPWSVIEDGVVIGDNTKVWQNVYIASGTEVGKGNVIHMGAILGHEPQHLLYKGERTSLKIGDNNVIREYVTIHRSFLKGESTVVGNGNYLMGFAHIAHDCRLGNNIVICQHSMLAGHVIVEDNVFISGGSAVHQFSKIGTLAMIGGLTRVNKDVPPYMLVVGPDSEVCSLNIVGIKRSALSQEARKQIKQVYKILYRFGLNTANALREIKKIPYLTKEVLHIIEFIEKSERGICKHRRNISLDEDEEA
ncbi:MAG: acyl-ACP--UDP-N-acetylglucosamine O-acyltransferase [Candidatus Omnitrophica bacterium]|nr:acyl-ACP--UDP-N-acetylglucosamine O-acyltransferase [Candidatus Omnitrophota bacterium]